MYTRSHPTHGTQVRTTDRTLALRLFVQENLVGLQNAATILGGSRGSRIIDCVRDGILTEDELRRSVWRALRELLGILTLENVHDESREESALFALIDPADPIVEQICLLTDGLREALQIAVEGRESDVGLSSSVQND